MAFDNDFGKKALIIGIVAVLAVVAIVLFFAFAGTAGFQREVAMIPLKGEIFMSGEGFSENYSALEIVELLEDAKNDPSVGVIFLDIDSPGGSVVATKQIVYKVREVRQSKPVISYIGEAGASGAYYVASASDYIISDADSITGSIGVISVIPSIKKLLEDFGVKVDVIKAGKFKAIGNIFEELDPAERQIIETIVEETFEQFKSDVLAFREEKISKSDFESIADGRILSGRQALSFNLVDELLPREKAIEKAAQIAGIEGKPVIKSFEKPSMSIFDLFFLGGQAFFASFNKTLSQNFYGPEITA